MWSQIFDQRQEVWWWSLDCGETDYGLSMSVSTLRRTSLSVSMSVLELNVTSFSCIFQRFTWLSKAIRRPFLGGFGEENCWLSISYAFRRSFGIWSWWHLQSFCWFYTTNICWWCIGAFWGPDLVQDDPHFGALQFTEDEVQSVLLELDVSKGAGPDSIPLFFLKNCAIAFARPFSFLFNRSLSTCAFPDIGGNFPNWHRYSR
jgi:hypothetical protein